MFGPYRLEIGEARLSHEGRLVALRPKAFAVLSMLASQPGALITKDELLDAVWGQRFITEGVIKSIVTDLRQALGDNPKAPRWIETVPRRGYRFIGLVRQEAPSMGAIQSQAPPAVPDGESGGPVEQGNLPQPLGELLGREQALNELSALVQHPLLTIVGPSGVGKTRVALALAASRRHHRRHGVWWVELASLAPESTSVGVLCAMVAQALRMDAASGSDPATLARSIHDLDALIVLDNAEHLIEVVASLISQLLDASASVRFVITSQEPLRIDGERIYRLSPLVIPEAQDDGDLTRLMASSAIQLFVSRAAERLHGFALAPDQQQGVATICRALDGVPLALELAAARVSTLGVRGIADLLLGDGVDSVMSDADRASARFALLTGGSRSGALRHRTLHNAIAWSYGLLDESQQRIFRRLGVFRGSFTLAAAQELCVETLLSRWMVVDAIEALVEKSILVRLEASGTPRFRLLESPRAFALERLAASADEATARDKHLSITVAHWRAADEDALREPIMVWLERQLPEVDNLRAALMRAADGNPSDVLMALVSASALFWCRAGLGAEGRRWCDLAEARLGALVGQAPLLTGIAMARATLCLYADVYAVGDVLPAIESAAADFEEHDPVNATFAIYLIFQLRLRLQTPFDRAALIKKMARLESPEWNPLMRRYLRQVRGYELRMRGDVAGYLEFCRSEYDLCVGMGAVAEAWRAAQGRMLAELDGGNIAAAMMTGRAALDDIRRAGHLRQHAMFFAVWLTLLSEHGSLEEAQSVVSDALRLLPSTPWTLHIAFAWMALRDGRPKDAARLLGWNVAVRASGEAMPPGQAIAGSTRSLETQLEAELGSETFARLRASGSTIGEGAARALHRVPR